MKILNKYIAIAVVFISVIACKTTPSLQQYFVEKQNSNDFIAFDIPASILQLKNTTVSEDVQKTLKSIKKVNLLALKLNDENKPLYNSEKQTIKTILKNSDYSELMRLKHKAAAIQIYILGKEDKIDEVVLFGYENNKGFIIARVLGEDMNPKDIVKLTQSIQLDSSSNELMQLGKLFEDIK
ncbi:DUF4252 domain-containing protein [Lutibacter sp.]